jgi:hypothetical protein
MRLELRFEGKIEITGNDGDADLHSLLSSLLQDFEVEELWHSPLITVAQARELIRLLDANSVELLRQIALGDGSITWPYVERICGIKGTDFVQYLVRYNDKINAVLQAVTQGKHSWLITYEDGAPAWATDDWKDAKLEIDGPALLALKKIFRV